jgi:inner membrane protein YidH
MNTAPVIPDSNQMAVDRTWLAHERTLMAWIRTATSMISFGFTIYKFFQYQTERGVAIRAGILSPRSFALIIVGIGLVSLLLATLAHRKETKDLARLGAKRHSLAEIVAGMIAGFGILVLIATVAGI